MSGFAIVAIVLFVLGYLAITLEEQLETNKAAVALALGGLLWVLVAAAPVERALLTSTIEETGAEIFAIVAFLLAAMALVEVLVHYRFFDLVSQRLSRMGLRAQRLFLVVGTITFFLSAMLDNLTTTIVMTQIARRFFSPRNLVITAGGIVILANAGGAWSPIGDVTTIMLWLAGKFSSVEIITQGFLPSLALAVVAMAMLVRRIDDDAASAVQAEAIALSRGERVVIGLSLASFSLPLIMNLIGLQPYMGLLLGLGAVWLFIEFAKVRSARASHLNADIARLLQRVDLASLQFFIGILLAVAALQALGLLERLSTLVFGENQETMRIIIGSILLGPLSAIVDNVPLTALAIEMIQTSQVELWVLLAITVGTGGSMLVIGSVPGVIAMGMVKELTFGRYLRETTLPAVVGFIAAVVVWLVQWQFIS